KPPWLLGVDASSIPKRSFLIQNSRYPDGIKGWMVKVDVNPDGGMQFDPNFFVDFGDQRVHQIRLQGGDASSDSYCFP
ncbi:MAG: selenium-binding protein SBP56-related protein, partial [Chloroflexus sp.]|uniref:selenium-binding protein SBP56-related protein n=1 Tax=Chloroflexus sp. TaxID=1904827 RepID=UPI0030A3C62B